VVHVFLEPIKGSLFNHDLFDKKDLQDGVIRGIRNKTAVMVVLY